MINNHAAPLFKNKSSLKVQVIYQLWGHVKGKVPFYVLELGITNCYLMTIELNYNLVNMKIVAL